MTHTHTHTHTRMHKHRMLGLLCESESERVSRYSGTVTPEGG